MAYWYSDDHNWDDDDWTEDRDVEENDDDRYLFYDVGDNIARVMIKTANTWAQWLDKNIAKGILGFPKKFPNFYTQAINEAAKTLVEKGALKDFDSPEDLAMEVMDVVEDAVDNSYIVEEKLGDIFDYMADILEDAQDDIDGTLYRDDVDVDAHEQKRALNTMVSTAMGTHTFLRMTRNKLIKALKLLMSAKG